MNGFLSKNTWPILFAAAILFPLLPLFPGLGIFSGDWAYHLWPMGYMGQYLKTHGSLPLVVNSHEMIFLPAPLFYGHIFYPALGLLSQWLGPALVVRLAVVALFCLQFFLVLALIQTLSQNRFFSFFIASLVTWAIYPLTNLYNRSALTELFATVLLTCCLASWFLMIFTGNRVSRIIFGWLGGWSLALAFGCHPITALYGSFFLVIAALGVIPFILKLESQARSQVLWLICFAFFLTVTLNLPWFYLNHLFLKKIFISTQGLGIFFYSGDIDSWRARFALYPHDLRIINSASMMTVPNPYIDAQINMPLLLFLVLDLILILTSRGVKIFKNKGPAGATGTVVRPAGIAMDPKGPVLLFVLGLALFTFTTWMSLSVTAYQMLPLFASIIQFVYRMISYQNLALFLILIALLTMGHPLLLKGWKGRAQGALILVCFLVSAVSAVIKNSHADEIRTFHRGDQLDFSADNTPAFLKMPYGYNTSTYISIEIPLLVPSQNPPSKKLNFELGTQENFGDPLPLEFKLSQGRWITTNVAAFSWNTLNLDGKPVASKNLRNDNRFLALWVESGTHHLQTEFKPDNLWLKMRNFSFPATGILSLIPLIALFF